jgi:hypothetical protein
MNSAFLKSVSEFNDATKILLLHYLFHSFSTPAVYNGIKMFIFIKDAVLSLFPFISQSDLYLAMIIKHVYPLITITI